MESTQKQRTRDPVEPYGTHIAPCLLQPMRKACALLKASFAKIWRGKRVDGLHLSEEKVSLGLETLENGREW
jgi:hypothetical protein